MAHNTDPLVHVAALGVVAGLRSQVPLALLSVAAQQHDGDQKLPAMLTTTPVTALLLASAAGEIVVDKLPFVPSRLMRGSLVFRAGFGALAGVLLARGMDQEPVRAAAIGAAGALAGSYVGYHIRAGLVSATGLPDPLFAIVEDAAAIALGTFAVGSIGQAT